MTSSESKAKTESDITPAGEETLHFVDDTSKGEDSCYSLARSYGRNQYEANRGTCLSHC